MPRTPEYLKVVLADTEVTSTDASYFPGSLGKLH